MCVCVYVCVCVWGGGGVEGKAKPRTKQLLVGQLKVVEVWYGNDMLNKQKNGGEG